MKLFNVEVNARRLLIVVLLLVVPGVAACAPADSPDAGSGGNGVGASGTGGGSAGAGTGGGLGGTGGTCVPITNVAFEPAGSFSTGQFDAWQVTALPREDGITDLIVAISTDPKTTSLGPEAEHLKNDGLGNFTLQTPLTLGGDGFPRSVSDFDGDGHLDLLALAVTAGNQPDCILALFHGDGIGGLSGGATSQFTVAGAQAICTIFIASHYGDNEVVDRNGDGSLDVIVGVQFTNSASAWLVANDGQGSFAPVGAYQPVYSDPSILGCSTMDPGNHRYDFNSDGIADEICAIAPQISPTYRVYLGQGGGNFQDGPELAIGQAIIAATADFNGDGHIDILAIGGGDPTIYRGDGTGSFQWASAYPNLLEGPSSFVITDLNCDGFPDVLSKRTDGVWAFINDGYGQLSNVQQAFPDVNGDYGRYIAMADFTGDGKIDVVAPLSSGGNPTPLVGLLKNVGN